MSCSTKVVAALLALVASIALAACGGSSDSNGNGGVTTAREEGKVGGAGGAGATTTIVIEDGEPAGGVQELESSAGEQVEFTVDSDVADEVHVHGYDLMKDVPADGSASFSFPADIEGIFEVELEGRGEQIAELRVNP